VFALAALPGTVSAASCEPLAVALAAWTRLSPPGILHGALLPPWPGPSLQRDRIAPLGQMRAARYERRPARQPGRAQPPGTEAAFRPRARSSDLQIVLVFGDGAISGAEQVRKRIGEDRAYVHALRDAALLAARGSAHGRRAGIFLPAVHARQLQGQGRSS
jgi:hypothetical protein